MFKCISIQLNSGINLLLYKYTNCNIYMLCLKHNITVVRKPGHHEMVERSLAQRRFRQFYGEFHHQWTGTELEFCEHEIIEPFPHVFHNFIKYCSCRPMLPCRSRMHWFWTVWIPHILFQTGLKLTIMKLSRFSTRLPMIRLHENYWQCFKVV